MALLIAVLFTMPYSTLGVQAATGKVTLLPCIVGQTAQGYRIAEYTLHAGADIDYSFSATGDVTFYVEYSPDVFPAPLTIRVWLVNVSSGQGVFRAWAGFNAFVVRNENTTATVTVFYNIHLHELVDWGLILIVIAAVAVAIAGTGIAVMIRSGRKGG